MYISLPVKLPRLVFGLILPVVLAACGGGGGGSDGGGGSTLSLSLLPPQVTASFYESTQYFFSINATVSGTAPGTVNVIIRDDVGVIEPTVDILQAGDDEYTADFRTVDTLTPGRHTGNIRIDLCADLACARRLGGSDLPYDFTVLAPATVAALSPGSTTLLSPDFPLTINGTNFRPEARVVWAGLPRTTTYLSPSQLSVSITSADVGTAGPVEVSVITDLPGASRAAAGTVVFQVLNPVPAVSAVTPGSVEVGASVFELTVAGTGFLPSSRIYLNGVERIVNTFLGPTELSTTINDGELAVAGQIPVRVFTPGPGGGFSNTMMLTVTNLVPAITTLDPEATTAGCGTTTVAANGSNFVAGATLLWNGSPRPTTFVNSSRVTAVISGPDLAASGTATVSVSTPAPGGGTTGTSDFSISAVGPATTSATAFQGNPRHDGFASIRCPSAFPMTPTWSRSFGNVPMTPLVAAGKVFALSFNNPDSELVALDPADGSIVWGPLTVPGRAEFAYDAGRVFVGSVAGSTGAASVRAIDADDGTQVWVQAFPGNTTSPLAPTAANGRVYVVVDSDGATQFAGALALNQADGSWVWNDLSHSNPAPPAVTADGVFLAYACEASRRDASTGLLDWSSNVGCSGGGSGFPVVAGDSMYSRTSLSPGWVRRDLLTGAPAGSFAVGLKTVPAFSTETRFAINGGYLVSTRIADGNENWRIRVPGTLDGSPAIVNDAVIVSDPFYQMLYAVDAETGDLRWSTAHAGLSSPGDYNGFLPLGYAVGDGLLIVPRGFELQAYRIEAAP